jgi:acetylornithine deacetylase/succinyl-diaminopimelate desuccinylase-like protein
MEPTMSPTAYSQIGQIASMRRVHEAFQWLHLHEQQMMRWQVELVSIPAPPFGEGPRAAWLVERFRELGLADVHLDEAGNALATLKGQRSNEYASTPLVLLSAHLDTVFAASTVIEPVLEGTRLAAPGACDNGAGVVALLGIAAALIRSGVEPDVDILFSGNVGEEGEGDLRGMRHIYADPRLRGRIAGHLVLDGAGHEVAVTGALGSRRFEVVIEGAGGHSWSDAGRPNPIVTLSEAIGTMNRLHLRAHAEDQDTRRMDAGVNGSALAIATRPQRNASKSTWNVGMVEGGASVNSIPELSRARFDLRSTDPEQLVRLEVQLHRALEDAVLAANAAPESSGVHDYPLRLTITSIGSRPAGTLRDGAHILDLLRAVDRHLNLRTECRTASTDANIPLSLGVEAISIGAGGDGGGIHTRGEWYDARGRALGLRRVLLLLLALAAPVERAMAAD